MLVFQRCSAEPCLSELGLCRGGQASPSMALLCSLVRSGMGLRAKGPRIPMTRGHCLALAALLCC